MGRPVVERDLAAAVLGALLRENYGGLARWVRPGPGGRVLHLPGGPGTPGPALPLEPDGFLADLRIRRPIPALTLGDVEVSLAAVASPADRDGVAAFTAECRAALASLHLRDRELPAVRVALALRGPVRRPWLGAEGQLRYDALAAAQPHPAYPTGAARLGFTDADALRYAPEYRPEFELNWVAVPRDVLVRAGHVRPPWWPGPADVGLPASLTGTHDLLPVHPLTARRELAAALTDAGLPAAGLVAPTTYLRVTPTLSTRTVALASRPGIHLKLPLPTSTLGRLNRRSIVPGTLADGALVHSIVAAAAAGREGPGDLLLADEGSYAHARHPYLGYLMRRLPDGLDRCHVVPIAALLAPDTRAGAGRHDRPLVIEELARQHADGSVTRLFQDYLRVLFGTHVDLFVRYGIALEAHQQNAAVVLDPDPAAAAPIRLLVKDFDGALIHYARLAAALSPTGAAPAPDAFADDRLLTGSDDALADVFITITVHLCAGALVFGLAEHHVAPLSGLLAMVRNALAEALDRHPGSPAARLLRTRVLDADRLPGKSMVTAGTLVAKSRTGARDINKYYGTTGPNYLKAPPPLNGACLPTALRGAG